MSSQVFPKPSELFNNVAPFSLAMLRNKVRDFTKRSFDITAALIGLILLAPVFVYIAILIKRDSPGPVFFWGSRMGRNGNPFRILKFRTMYENPESYQGPKVTGAKDSRITPLGHWLRDTKINELPQLWNVLIGEMSLVGPRPEDVDIAKTWAADAFQEILSVRPGITSPASVLYHDEEKLLSKDNLMGDYLKKILPDKLRLDRLYVRHHSFFSDLDAIFWTIAIILPQLAKTKIPEGYIFAGPISRLFYRYVNWVIIDFVVSLIVAYVATLTWGLGTQYSTEGRYLAIPILLALIFSSFNSAIGLDRVLWSQATVDDGIRLMISSVFMTVIIWALQPIYRWLSLPPTPSNMLLFIGALAGFGFLLTRYRLRLLSSLARRWVDWRQQTSNVGERVLLVGMGDGNKLANYLINQRTFRTAFSIVGTVDNSNPSQHGMRVSGSWLLGSIKDIPALVKRYDIGMILSTIPLQEPENEHILELAQTTHTKLIFLDDLLFMTDRQMTRPQGQVDSEMWLGGRLEYRAMHDIVTNLPNRYLLRDRLQHSLSQAKRYGTPPGLVFVEFSQLGSLNDDLGNKVTDEVLKVLAKRFENCKRESDTLARFGFDKFAFLLENVPSEREMDIVVQRINTALSEPVNLNGQNILLNARIGQCLCQRTCDAFDTPEKADLVRCYGCAMANATEFRREIAYHYENVLGK